MGQLRYLSAMQHTAAVVGNSSSGIVEAPSFKVPTVNIGDRQKGRIQAQSVIDCKPTQTSIKVALEKAVSLEFIESLQDVISPYEKDGTVKKIKDVLKNTDLKHIIKKEFYDLESYESAKAAR